MTTKEGLDGARRPFYKQGDNLKLCEICGQETRQLVDVMENDPTGDYIPLCSGKCEDAFFKRWAESLAMYNLHFIERLVQ